MNYDFVKIFRTFSFLNKIRTICPEIVTERKTIKNKTIRKKVLRWRRIFGFVNKFLVYTVLQYNQEMGQVWTGWGHPWSFHLNDEYPLEYSKQREMTSTYVTFDITQTLYGLHSPLRNVYTRHKIFMV